MSENTSVRFPSLLQQAENLVALEVPALLGISASELLEASQRLAELTADDGSALLVPQGNNPDYQRLMALVHYREHPGFVVEDFADIGEFVTVTGPESQVVPPVRTAAYALVDPHRGDEFANASPAEALADITARNRIGLTALEGIFWLLQQPEQLQRNHCFMTIGLRKPKGRSWDSRTPALWISNGTGRDGATRRNAPKLGWCWWNNRHTWLGIAHGAQRVTL